MLRDQAKAAFVPVQFDATTSPAEIGYPRADALDHRPAIRGVGRAEIQRKRGLRLRGNQRAVYKRRTHDTAQYKQLHRGLHSALPPSPARCYGVCVSHPTTPFGHLAGGPSEHKSCRRRKRTPPSSSRSRATTSRHGCGAQEEAGLVRVHRPDPALRDVALFG